MSSKNAWNSQNAQTLMKNNNFAHRLITDERPHRVNIPFHQRSANWSDLMDWNLSPSATQNAYNKSWSDFRRPL